MLRSILTLTLTLVPASLCADEKKLERPKPDPEGTPLELTISTKAAKFTLKGELRGEAYKKKIEAAAKAGMPILPPAVELTYEIKNTSDKPVKVWTTGDPVVMTLELKGKGALNLDPALAFTEEFRLPKAVEIAPGKTHTFGIITMMSGFRNRSHYSYWTEPGDYELVATFKTGMSPAPKGAKEGMDGFGLVTLTSPALKLTVEEKEKK